MWQVSWTDTHTGERKSITLHRTRNVEITTQALQRDPYRYTSVEVRRLGQRRFRELVIVLGQ